MCSHVSAFACDFILLNKVSNANNTNQCSLNCNTFDFVSTLLSLSLIFVSCSLCPTLLHTNHVGIISTILELLILNKPDHETEHSTSASLDSRLIFVNWFVYKSTKQIVYEQDKMSKSYFNPALNVPIKRRTWCSTVHLSHIFSNISFKKKKTVAQ